MNKKKLCVICLCVVLSILAGLYYEDDIFLTNSKDLIEILLTILGLCFSGVTFVLSSSSKIVKDRKENNNLSKIFDKITNDVKGNVSLILYFVVFLIVCNLFIHIDIPFVINPTNVNFGLFVIKSFKQFIFNFIYSISFCLSFYAFYDLIKATFQLLRYHYK